DSGGAEASVCGYDAGAAAAGADAGRAPVRDGGGGKYVPRGNGVGGTRRGSARSEALVLLPGAEQASQQNELAQVVRVVVGEHQRFTQHGLSGAVGNAGKQVGLRVGHEALHDAQVALHLGHARVPGGGLWRGVVLGPVARRPLRRNVLLALRELDDIPLRNADVLEQAPRGKGLPGGSRAPERAGPIGERVPEGDVGVTAAQQLEHVVADGAMWIGAARLPFDGHAGLLGFWRSLEV